MVLLFGFWCLLAVALQNVQALRCRTENQQMDMQFEKVLQICKKRNSMLGSSNLNSRSTESDSFEDESNSDEDIFSKKFSSKNQDRSYATNQRDRNNQNRMSNSYGNNRTDAHRWNTGRNMRGINNQQPSRYSRTYNNRNNAFDKADNNNNYLPGDQGCVIQCFFNEFNAVDQKGFPLKHAVIRLMKQNIQDSELQDFIQESVEECFIYLQLVNAKDNCEFSQYLISCLSAKGKEKCDDWEN